MYPESIITKRDQEIVTARVESEDDYKNSMTKNRGKYVGFMTERKFMGWCQKMGFDCRQTNTHNDDFLVNGKTVDVKAKLRNVITNGHHEASVWKSSMSHQKPEFYVFGSVLKNRIVQLIGWLEYDQFLSLSRIMNKGMDQGNMSIVEDCRNVYHWQTNSMDSFMKVKPEDQTTDEWLADYNKAEE
tara:strand:- start:3686 stop:4243 length:558 start_codon:yes stop_codon:yes gene_type:complete